LLVLAAGEAWPVLAVAGGLEAFAVLAVGGTVAGCTRPAPVVYEQELSEAPGPARHAVHSERLTQVMRGLDRLDQERLPQGLDLEVASGPWVAELVAVAQAIARSAEEIPQAAFQASLTESEHVAFHQRAALLRERALALARGAEQMSPEERSRAVVELRETCDGCHTEFRAPRESDEDGNARESDGS
jgi:hypothetical protein